MVDEKGENSYCRHPWAGPLGGQESLGFTHSAWELGKKIQMNCSQNRNRLTDLEKKFTRRGRVVRGIDLEFGIDTCKDLL